MSERLQITVTDEIAQAWREAAETTGVSLSSWIIARANRPDCDRILTRINHRLDRMDKATAGGPQLDEEEEWMLTELERRSTSAKRPCDRNRALRIAVRIADAAMVPKETDASILREVLGGARGE